MRDWLGPSLGGNRIAAFLPSLRGYKARFLAADFVAGLSLAAVAIPSQMATAHLGGFPPQIGFFAFMGGVLGFAVFGANRFLCCCADSTITPIFAGSLALVAAAGTRDYAVLSAALAVMVGLALVAAGLFRLGRIGDLLSIPVTVGFLVGIAAHILFSQVPTILGIALPSHASEIPAALGAINPFTVAIAFGELAVLLAAQRIDPRIPAALIGLGVATLSVLVFRLEAHGVAILGEIPRTFPFPAIPMISAAEIAELFPLTLVVMFIVIVQTAATTREYASGEPADLDRDIFGVGTGSILAGLLGTFPVDASPPSTEIAMASGARSQLTCLVAATILFLLLLFGAELLRDVPRAALSGVLLFVALKIIRFDQIAAVFRQSLPEFLVIVATASAIIFLPIGEGVAIGIGLSLVRGILDTASGKVIVFKRVPGTPIWWPPTENQKGETLAGVAVLSFDAPLSFLNADRLRREITAVLREANATSRETPMKLIVLEAANISRIDFTAAASLRATIRDCHVAGVDFAIARLESLRAGEALRRFGLDTELGQDRVFRSVEEAVQALAHNAPIKAP
jgi:sulfate permease, SulP family